MLYGQIEEEKDLTGTLETEVVSTGGGSIDEDEFNREYIRQVDLIMNVLNGDKFVEYTEDEILAMENKLINITKGGN